MEPISSTIGSLADAALAAQSGQNLVLPSPSVFQVPSIQGGHQVICGKSEIGTVHFLPQIHTIYRETPEELRALGLEQLKIARMIEELGTKTVFVEGLYKDLSLATPEKAIEFCEYVKWILPSYLRERMNGDSCTNYIRRLNSESLVTGAPTDELLMFLGATSGAFYLLALDPSITLKGTVSQEVDVILYKWQQQESYGSPNDLRIRFALRERIAAREIREHLRDHPGDEVILIYGKAHTFTEAFRRAFSGNPPLVMRSTSQEQDLYQERQGDSRINAA